jgi:hypothetical protein
MINDKGLLYLIQPAELVGTQRYKIGYSRNNDIDKFRRDYKKGSRFLDIYEYDRSPLLIREIRNNFNNKFKLVAGRTYYEGNENDIKKNFNTIIKNYSCANNINSQNIINNQNQNLIANNNNNNNNICNKYGSLTNYDYYNNCNKYESLTNYNYMQNIIYGSKCQEMKKNRNLTYKSYYEDACNAKLNYFQ